MSSNQITDGPKQVLEWKELVWQDTIATEQLTDVLERFATAPELGRIVLEFRVDKNGARWLIGSGAAPPTSDQGRFGFAPASANGESQACQERNG